MGIQILVGDALEQLRDGLRSSREHPEKARVYEVADCTFGVMKFGEKVCAMFSLPLKVRK